MQMQGHQKNPTTLPTSSTVWVESLDNQIYNTHLPLICPNNVWPVTYRVQLKAEVFNILGHLQKAFPSGGVSVTSKRGRKLEVAHNPSELN